MKKLLLLFLFFPSILLAVTGNTNLVGLRILTNGFVCQATIGGDTATSFGTNVVVFNGFGTNNSLSSTTALILTVTGPGFNGDGSYQASKTRLVYGTDIMRWVYPSNNWDEAIAQDAAGTNVIVNIALSDFIMSNETITATALGGYLRNTNSSVDAAAFTAATVTNGSVQLWQKPVSNWTDPHNKKRETNLNITVKSIAFHESAKNANDGHPIACMVHVITDLANSHKFTNFVREMSVDRSQPTKGMYYAEYISTFPLSNFTNLAALRYDMICLPAYGDSNAVFSTFDNEFPGITGCPTSLTNQCDRSRTEGLPPVSEAFAVVGGPPYSDANGRATNNTGGPTTLDSSLYFVTMAKAAEQLAATNKDIYGHFDVGAAIMYVRQGVSNVYGADLSYGTNPWCKIIIRPYPGDTVTLSNFVAATDSDLSDAIQFVGMNFEGPNIAAGSVLAGGTDFLELTDCTINTLNSQYIQNTKACWLDNCLILNCAQGLSPLSTKTDHFMLKGCLISNFNNKISPQLMIGCVKPNTNRAGVNIVSDVGGQGGKTNTHIIWYNNFLGGFNLAGADSVTMGANAGCYIGGMADIQNVYEYSISNDFPNLHFSATLNSVHYTNILIWNNAMLGKRCGYFYNDGGTVPSYKYHCQELNNIFHIAGYKSDNFDGGTNGNGARVGNWPVMWQVGCGGQMDIEITIDQGSGTFAPEFAGMNSYRPRGTGTNSIVDILRFRNNQAYDGSSTRSFLGGGDYRQKNHSLSQTQVRGFFVLPRDIDCAFRSKLDFAGPYAAGTPNKGF